MHKLLFAVSLVRAITECAALSIPKRMFKMLELKIPPLAIVLICAGLMYTCAVTMPHKFVAPTEIRTALAVATGMVATGVIIAALMTFRRHHTTMNPLNPDNTTSLVTNGIYAYSRNPMYLSMLIGLLGWGFLLGQLSTIFGPVLFFAAITRFQILPEEHILERKFGLVYTSFLASSCRWLGLRR